MTSARKIEPEIRSYFDLDPLSEVWQLATLTPGDFEMVGKKAVVLRCLDDSNLLAGMFREECEAKPERRGLIGLCVRNIAGVIPSIVIGAFFVPVVGNAAAPPSGAPYAAPLPATVNPFAAQDASDGDGDGRARRRRTDRKFRRGALRAIER